MLANAASRDAGRTEIRGRQAVLHRRPRPRRPDRARPQFLRRPAELAAAKAHHPDPRRSPRSRPIHPIPKPRCGIRPAPRSRRPATAPACAPARSRSSADPTCSECSWTVTTRSGCRRRRRCGCRTASPASPACPRVHRRQILAAHGLKRRRAANAGCRRWRQRHAVAARRLSDSALDVAIGRLDAARPRP